MVAMIARKDMPAHHLGAAVGDILHSPPMRKWHTMAESVTVRRPVDTEDVRYVRHDCLKISQKAIEGFGERLEALIGQVGIDGGSLGTFMSQKLLNHA